eukprot:1344832-Pyramimonas_sp.AAC.1
MNYPGLLYCLGQDANEHPQHSKNDQIMQPIIRKPELYHSPQHGRWLTPWELFTVHNYPIDPTLSWYGMTCSFNVARDSKGFPPRRRNALLTQVGNGMSLATESLGINLIWALRSLAEPPSIPIARVPSQTSGSSLVEILRRGAAASSAAPPKKRLRARAKKGDPGHVEAKGLLGLLPEPVAGAQLSRVKRDSGGLALSRKKSLAHALLLLLVRWLLLALLSHSRPCPLPRGAGARGVAQVPWALGAALAPWGLRALLE